ncbi:leucine zipper putative tumor suppressor 2 homolog isoform X1 [Cheilinus undulatus]|uniref:leucine zipper putative tumor suppressor 2 homolog isoform X1 n=1 Tax=Cheilinus undulatus TaxID=241271 RepID=UPI001BD6AEF1|nr:leucine zipper putative tumor suppressor 2 homolog isoform X1 [Cheilinus undulatus]XP_041671368.1 leucine zipper putative tumor suppressor 2 homolog isoform X1 [Cheilinus undulatus]XP_041671369.1 leucine zipper putative tumor suppressor 2 homolog isoform X1 [Cheilinus undulatus]XP_041671370.1 leucine zipper putative tumor suppressor 2 homolog isoform X1 [Cheilinus undulatus]XP_041671371.1 leucine zipper putative tumor suppressor 2 homolog isoform X1 [Cheilinus undulatus]XP_041671372.1 leuci
MALVQALPVSAEPHTPSRRRHPSSSPPLNAPPSTLDPMGSVSSLIATRPGPYQDLRSGVELGARIRRPTPGASCLGSESPQDPLLQNIPPLTKQSSVGSSRGQEKEIGNNGNHTYLNEDFVGDWNDNHVTPDSPGTDVDGPKDGSGLNGNMGGPPPKLIPVSGKLERNMEKTVLRPTAFKPVIPKNRTSMQYLSPRHVANVSEGQNNLNLLSPTHRETSPSSSEKCSMYSRTRNSGGSNQSCQMTDSGRNSLCSLPPYSSAPFSQTSGETTAGHLEPLKGAAPVSTHGHSNSDSGRSSSSKSTGSGSISGRGHPLSDSGSGGRSPGPVDGYEGVVRDLEDKLRERELELQTLRENLDENEAAICQVYEEKQKRFELELEELRQSCATRMQVASQKAQRAQQVLQLQVYQLQQEKKKLQEDFAQLLQEREQLEERCTSYEHEKIQLGPRLEESKWEVCQKSGEISLLKQQLKEVQGELAQRVGEIVSLRSQLRETRGELTNTQVLLQEANGTTRTRTLELEVCENELQRRKSEAELLREKVGRLEGELVHLRDALANQGPGNRQCQVFQEAEEQLLAYESDEAKAQRQSSSEALQNMKAQMDRMRAELAFERQRAEQQMGSFEEERRIWQEEKDKVIRYQKQLQQNYVQMYRRNRELEQLLQELSQEEDEGSGNEINFDEIAATEI